MGLEGRLVAWVRMENLPWSGPSKGSDGILTPIIYDDI